MARRQRRRTGLRHSLLARLLAGSLLIAVCSISATAWLAARSTSGTIRHEQGQTLANDARINDTLLGYAATHPAWAGIAQTIRDLAHRTGRRIALTTEHRESIADSARPRTPLPTKASAVVDPLAVDVTLAPGAPADRIDPRAVGPFGLSATEQARLRKAAETQAVCMRSVGQNARVVFGLSGRAFIQVTGAITPREPYPPGPPGDCPEARTSSQPTFAEAKALKQLNTLVDECLALHGVAKIRLELDRSWKPELQLPPLSTRPTPTSHLADPASGGSQRRVSDCIASGRRTQLKPFVAPTALLFIGDPGNGTTSGVGLSAAGMARIAAAALVILVLTVGVSFIVASRLVRPVHALTDAAWRMRAGDGSARVAVRPTGEVGQLAVAFNEMSEHLDRLEHQRKVLVSDISHDLRTPLSNIRGWLEAVQDGITELDPALISSLVEEILLLQHIIDDLQELALADVGKLRLHREPVRIGDLLDQVATAHRGRAVSAHLKLITELSGEPSAYADPVRLRQAIGNLVSNALRYTHAGGTVTLRAREAGDQVLIEVRDTGIGIAPEDLPHVFDRFWRAEKSRNRRTGGNGLGLAIVRSLIEAHGGTATATSTPGEGTTFTLRLPIRR